MPSLPTPDAIHFAHITLIFLPAIRYAICPRHCRPLFCIFADVLLHTVHAKRFCCRVAMKDFSSADMLSIRAIPPSRPFAPL